jgi:hypothetical protein
VHQLFDVSFSAGITEVLEKRLHLTLVASVKNLKRDTRIGKIMTEEFMHLLRIRKKTNIGTETEVWFWDHHIPFFLFGTLFISQHLLFADSRRHDRHRDRDRRSERDRGTRDWEQTPSRPNEDSDLQTPKVHRKGSFSASLH